MTAWNDDVTITFKAWETGILAAAMTAFIRKANKPMRGELPSERAMRLGTLTQLEDKLLQVAGSIQLAGIHS